MINAVFVIGTPVPIGVKVGDYVSSSYGIDNPGYYVKNFEGQRWVVLREFRGYSNLHQFQGPPASMDEIDNFIRTLQEHQISMYNDPVQMKICSE